MSSIINLKKEILKVVLDSDGDLEKMNIDNVVKLAVEIKNCTNMDKVKVKENNEEVDSLFDLKKSNMNNLSVFESESDIIFNRMRKAHDKMESNNEDCNNRREFLKQQLLATLNNK
jgi:hypothetical protein